MKHCASTSEAILACGSFGAMYGAVAGGLYGGARLLLLGEIALLGMVVGSVLGAIGGFATGIIAGGVICREGVGDGSFLGWSIGGFAVGIAFTAFFTLVGDRNLVWNVIPALIGGALGLIVGIAMQEGQGALPGLNWLVAIINDSVKPDKR